MLAQVPVTCGCPWYVWASAVREAVAKLAIMIGQTFIMVIIDFQLGSFGVTLQFLTLGWCNENWSRNSSLKLNTVGSEILYNVNWNWLCTFIHSQLGVFSFEYMVKSNPSMHACELRFLQKLKETKIWHWVSDPGIVQETKGSGKVLLLVDTFTVNTRWLYFCYLSFLNLCTKQTFGTALFPTSLYVIIINS